VLLNNAGNSIEATVNKAAAGNDAAFAFKTGFSARALIGLLGSDDFSFEVSPDGAAYFDAILVDRTSGRVELPKPAILLQRLQPVALVGAQSGPGAAVTFRAPNPQTQGLGVAAHFLCDRADRRPL
jgi:hypothetical protein